MPDIDMYYTCLTSTREHANAGGDSKGLGVLLASKGPSMGSPSPKGLSVGSPNPKGLGMGSPNPK